MNSEEDPSIPNLNIDNMVIFPGFIVSLLITDRYKIQYIDDLLLNYSNHELRIINNVSCIIIAKVLQWINITRDISKISLKGLRRLNCFTQTIDENNELQKLRSDLLINLEYFMMRSRSISLRKLDFLKNIANHECFIDNLLLHIKPDDECQKRIIEERSLSIRYKILIKSIQSNKINS